jgi:hypothetical protein
LGSYIAFLAPLIAPLIGFAGTAAGAATIAAVGTVAATGMMSKQTQGSLAAPVTAPNAPQSYAAISAAETTNALKRAQSRTKTILTSPLGVTDNTGSNIQRKSLLGT